MRTSPIRTFLLAGLALSLGASAALAQEKKPEDAPLKGPSVKQGVPGEQRQFSPGRQKGKDAMGGEIPHRAFMRALENLKTGPEATRLTSEQAAKVKAINEEFQASVADYRAENQREIRTLLAQLSPEERRRAEEYLRQQGGRPEQRRVKKDAADEPMTDAKPKTGDEAKARLREIMAGAPSQADTHAKVFEVLNDGQKKAFQAELQKVKDEMGKREMRPAKDAGKPGDAPKMDLNDPRIPERMRERINNLPPEQREEALKRALERRRGGEGGGNRDKPAPSTKKDVDVPKPD